jgi:hypothetical protein
MFNSAINWYNGTPEYTNASASWANLAYGNGVFVALEANGSCVMYSSDGSNWQYGNNPNIPTGFYTLAFGNGLFIASAYNSGFVFRSTNGINWERNTTATDFAYLGGNSERLIANTASDQFYSTDGINWTKAARAGTVILNWASPIVVLGSRIRYYSPTSQYRMAISDDGGLNWTTPILQFTPNGLLWRGAAGRLGTRDYFLFFIRPNGGGAFNGIAISTPAAGNWTLSPNPLPYSLSWSDMAFGAEKFVAIASGSNLAAYGTRRSSDGAIIWTGITLPFSLSDKGFNEVFGAPRIVWGNGRFVIVDPSLKSAYSTDGINWTQSASLPTASPLALDSIYPFSLSNILNVPSEFI